MPEIPAVFDELEPRTSRFYLNALAVLAEEKVPFFSSAAPMPSLTIRGSCGTPRISICSSSRRILPLP